MREKIIIAVAVILAILLGNFIAHAYEYADYNPYTDEAFWPESEQISIVSDDPPQDQKEEPQDGAFFPGQGLTLEVRILRDGLPVTDAAVVLSFSVNGQAYMQVDSTNSEGVMDYRTDWPDVGGMLIWLPLQ